LHPREERTPRSDDRRPEKRERRYDRAGKREQRPRAGGLVRADADQRQTDEAEPQLAIWSPRVGRGRVGTGGSRALEENECWVSRCICGWLPAYRTGYFSQTSDLLPLFPHLGN